MFKLKSCIRRKTDSIDKRFCFDIEVAERSVTESSLCFQKSLFADLDWKHIQNIVFDTFPTPQVCCIFPLTSYDCIFDHQNQNPHITDTCLYQVIGALHLVHQEKLIYLIIDVHLKTGS